MIKHANFSALQSIRKLFGKTDDWRKIYKQTSSAFSSSYGVFLNGAERNILLGHKIF